MATIPSPDTPLTDQAVPAEQDLAEQAKKRNKLFRAGIAACKNYRRKLMRDWSLCVDYRRGKPFASQSDEDRVIVNLDWSYVKMKQASLFSQVPPIRVNHPPQTIDPKATWLHAFEQRINDMMVKSGVESAMNEALPDCINAAGIGVIIASHEALSEDVQVPSIDFTTMDPMMAQQIQQSGLMPDGSPIPMETVPRITDHRYVIRRVSPSDFLWPVSFTGSDFDDAPWIGRTGRISWTEAKRRWKLDDSQKEKYLGDNRQPQDSISNDQTEKDVEDCDETVTFDELFYKAHDYVDGIKMYDTIHHLIFISGKEEPVVDEQWEGQREDPQGGGLIGVLRYPITVLALTYISDDAIPPSDSAVARPQVNEINKSRTQMIQQREHSLPVRWFNTDRVDPTVQYNLMKGVWQGMIPVQGNGEHIIGEISSAKMPSENFTFYQMAQQDLTIMWNVGQDQSGQQVETKGEAQSLANQAQTRTASDRAMVGKFYTRIAQVVGGLITLHEDPASFGEGFSPAVSRTLAYSILADSTVLLDTNQRRQQCENFINFAAKSGFVEIEPVLREYATLSGFDPNVVIRAPQPKPPAEPSISLRLTGTEDMMNPLTLAFLINSGQAPKPEHIAQAKEMIKDAVTPPPQPVPQLGPDGQMLPQPPSGPGMPPGPPPPGVGEAHPDWSASNKVNQRVLDRENQ